MNGFVNQNVIAMLACARIGAVHCVVFGGFSKEALAGRIVDSGAKVVITQVCRQRLAVRCLSYTP